MKKRRPRRTALFHACYFLAESSRSHWVTVQKVCVFNGFGVVPYECVDHGKLLKQMWTLGIRDKKLLSIISAMLKAEVAGIGFPEKGTPQGGIISPLLSNIVQTNWIGG